METIYIMIIILFIICGIIIKICYDNYHKSILGNDEINEDNNEIENIYNSGNILSDIKEYEPITYKVLIKYMMNKVNISQNIINKFQSMIGEHPDKKLIQYLIGNLPSAEKREYKYHTSTDFRATRLSDIIKKLSNNAKLNSLLDIGSTERQYVVNLAEELGINPINAFGINISDQEGKVDYQVDESGIIIYDGVHIPSLNGHSTYDIITITSVLHHVPYDIYDKLIESICKRANRYVLIKEYDITSETTKVMVHIQHALFWGKLYKDFTRYDINKDKLMEDFSKHGMKLINHNGMNIFTRAGYYLFKKIKEYIIYSKSSTNGFFSTTLVTLADSISPSASYNLYPLRTTGRIRLLFLPYLL